MVADLLVIGLYILAMLGIGWVSVRMAKTKSDYLVAGRRLGWFMYSGTMSAVVLGGASTVGGVKLGYTHGISGAWLVVSIGIGILALHALFARRLVRLRVYTVGEMLRLRYGDAASTITGVVMWVYTLMITVTSTLAFATIFTVLLDLPDLVGILIGGSITVLYSTLGGMWSITLTDIAQFVIKTVGFLLVLLPVAVAAAGGFSGMSARLPASYFSPTSIGGAAIVAYLVTYGLGLLIGQDIWQRVFTARTPAVATGGGILSGGYCVLYGLAGALIGAAGKALYPDLANAQDAFATIAERLLPAGLRGLVLAAALAAMMSTASGALIGCATVTTTDLLPGLPGGFLTRLARVSEVNRNRLATLTLGLLAIGIALVVRDVVGALTVAYNVLVGGLLVAILGALFWPRGTRTGAVASIGVGALVVVASMVIEGLDASSPIFYGLAASLVTYLAVSLATPPTPADVLDRWTRRLAGQSGSADTIEEPVR